MVRGDLHLNEASAADSVIPKDLRHCNRPIGCYPNRYYLSSWFKGQKIKKVKHL